MKRVALNELQAIVSRINQITFNTDQPYSQIDGKLVANIGCYHIDQAYGGVELVQMQTAGGGVRDVLRSGHVSKRELRDLMFAYIVGLDDGVQL